MDIDTKQVISQIVAFLIMLWILKRFAWKPLLKVMDDRRLHIQTEFEAIDQQKLEIEKIKDDYKDAMKNIDIQARTRLQEGVNEGRKIAQEIQQSARLQSQEIIKKAQEEIKEEANRAKIQLKNDVVELTMQVTNKVIKSSIDANKQKELVNEFLKEAEFK